MAIPKNVLSQITGILRCVVGTLLCSSALDFRGERKIQDTCRAWFQVQLVGYRVVFPSCDTFGLDKTDHGDPEQRNPFLYSVLIVLFEIV